MIVSVCKYYNYYNIYTSAKLAQLLWRLGPTCEVGGTNLDEGEFLLQIILSFLCINMIVSVCKYCTYCNIYISAKLAQLLWRLGPTCEVVGTNPDEEDFFLQSFLCIP